MKTPRNIGWIFFSILPFFTASVSAQSLTNIHSFSGFPTEGSAPYTALVQDRNGNFYGTTYHGGTSTNCPNGCGTVFRVSPNGSLTNLYSFSGADGKYPTAGLVQGTDGSFYGTTTDGGNTNLNVDIGIGTVFRITSGGTLTSLHTFTITYGISNFSTNSEGTMPAAGLVQGSDGNFYGIASEGGPSTNCGRYGCGTIFRISPNGTFTNIHSFNGTDGQVFQNNRLAQGSDGNFYGTTFEGGMNAVGTVFRISSDGSFTNLYTFSGTDGANSDAELVLGSDCNFYGTTEYGGTGSYGSVFRISPGGSLTNLYSFHLYGDGAYPSAGLVQGSDGNFYGSTYFGGTNTLNDFGGLGYGTLFRISPTGSLTNLYTFSRSDTAYLKVKLIQASDGNFYGTSWFGGSNSQGIVFRFSVPLSAPPYPINQITAVQKTTTNFVVSIPSVAGETYQMQFTTNLTSGNWSNVPSVSVTNSIGGLLTLTNSGGALLPQGFYRFVITP